MRKTIVKVYTFQAIEDTVGKFYVKKTGKVESGGWSPRRKHTVEDLEIECIDTTFEEMCKEVEGNVCDIAECTNRLARVEEWELGYCGQMLNRKYFRYIHEDYRFEEVEVE